MGDGKQTLTTLDYFVPWIPGENDETAIGKVYLRQRALTRGLVKLSDVRFGDLIDTYYVVLWEDAFVIRLVPQSATTA